MSEEIVKEMEHEITTVGEQALALKVVNAITYSKAGEILVLHKNLEKKIKTYFKPLKETADKAWKTICNRENEEVAKLTPTIHHLNKEMTVYHLIEEKKRKEEEDRLRRELEKKAEEEKLAMALEAEKAGAKEEAEEILNEPVFVPPPIVEKIVPKVAGQTMTTTWKWRLKNINKVPRQYLQINKIAVNQVVRALKENAKIDGIEVYPASSMRGVRQ